MMNLRQSILFLGIMFGGFASTISADATVASSNLSQTTPKQEISLEFPSSDREQNTVRQRRTSPRTRCPDKCIPLTSNFKKNGLDTTGLMPKDNIGTTITSNPTIVWFLPEHQAQRGKLYIFDEESPEDLYEAAFELPDGPSIVKFKLPKELELKPGTEYIWLLEIYCTEEGGKDAAIHGYLKRQELDESLEIQLKEQAEDSLEKVEIYAKAKAWNEALLGILSLREEYPQQWREFLASVELAHLANFPVVEIEEVIEETITTNNN
ncbi:MAG: DUF928 domain-containing protein [Spirulinaceae cyanobacterium]